MASQHQTTSIQPVRGPETQVAHGRNLAGTSTPRPPPEVASPNAPPQRDSAKPVKHLLEASATANVEPPMDPSTTTRHRPQPSSGVRQRSHLPQKSPPVLPFASQPTPATHQEARPDLARAPSRRLKQRHHPADPQAGTLRAMPALQRGSRATRACNNGGGSGMGERNRGKIQ